VSAARLAFLYAAFAVVATVANLVAQWLVLLPAHTTPRAIAALVVGTLVGMPIKYVLDKRYIFRVQAEGIAHDLRMFVLYAAMAVVTTVLFWVTELAVGLATDSRAGLLAGGALGLCAGYALKYQLDKRYVFPQASVVA